MAASGGAPGKEGSVLRKDVQRRTWESSWLVVRPGWVAHYDRKGDTQPKAAAHLKGCIASRLSRKDFSFAAHVPSLSCTLLLKGKSDEDVNEWIVAFSQCADLAPAGQTPVLPPSPRDSPAATFNAQLHDQLGRLERTAETLAELFSASMELPSSSEPQTEASLLRRLSALNSGLASLEVGVLSALRPVAHPNLPPVGAAAPAPKRSPSPSPRDRAATAKVAPPVPARDTRPVLNTAPSPPPAPETPRSADADKLDPLFDFLLSLDHRRVVSLPAVELPAEIFAPPLEAPVPVNPVRASLTSEEVERQLSKGPPRRPAPSPTARSNSGRSPSATVVGPAPDPPSPRNNSPLPRPSAAPAPLPTPSPPGTLARSLSGRQLLNRSQPLPAPATPPAVPPSPSLPASGGSGRSLTALPPPVTPAKPVAKAPGT